MQLFLNSIASVVPSISDQNKQVSQTEMAESVKSTQKGQSPACDGLTISFHLHVWDILEDALFKLFNSCIEQEKLSNNLKQGLICLFLKPGKDVSSLENWRLITLLNIDYKILAQICVKKTTKKSSVRFKQATCQRDTSAQTSDCFTAAHSVGCPQRFLGFL